MSRFKLPVLSIVVVLVTLFAFAPSARAQVPNPNPYPTPPTTGAPQPQPTVFDILTLLNSRSQQADTQRRNEFYILLSMFALPLLGRIPGVGPILTNILVGPPPAPARTPESKS